ncbi:hypothetical protein F0U44_13230 [Nocardioides humilatus]|uniref:Protein kinase domain-containing protein n=1 Tax=Nocardioides humilatus TaxID=2607660 RepID=A0A5B1LFF3_9ACTN|nr:hypothetical protein [Nocardioides humilatus]KAA1419392.1 hypothetical protein F0U44_13230 [Nocardioides humilatus]
MTVLEITNYGRNTLRRLRLEARILDASLQPRLAPAYELDPNAPTATLVTELLPDLTLDDLVSISPLPAAAALHALRDVAATLHAMHECGLVHGALRPAGVFILPDGRAALARPDAVPEGAGATRQAAVWADSYGFAVLAFELLTGIHPLDLTNGSAMTPSLASLPPRAATVLKRALTTTPARRPLPLELIGALEAIPAERWASNHLKQTPAHPLAPPLDALPTPPAPAVEPPVDAVPEVQPLAPPDPMPVVSPEEVVAAPEGPPSREAPALVAVAVIAPAPRKRSVFRRIVAIFTGLVALLTVLTGGAAGAWLLFSPATATDPMPGPPQVERMALSITPPQANCPRAAMHLSATIVTDGGEGPLVVRWVLPDGTVADTQSLMAMEGQRVLRTSFDLRLSGRREIVGRVRATVTPTNTQASVPLRYLCASERSGRSRSI